jgi:anaerobic selenocysteine-containing dehydrogenase
MPSNVLPTICALDCPDACSLKITVEDGKVVHLAGDREHPITKGFACAKMARYPQRQEQEDRVLFPMRRVGAKGEGRFERISWDTAFDEIASRLKNVIDRHGAQSVLPYAYGGTMGVIQSQAPLALFRSIGALELDQTICAATGGAGWEANYGPNKLGTDPEDLVSSQVIILWGINALRSNSHIAPVITAARKNGCRVLHIDPYRNETSRFADAHWQIKVGTDAALALAFGNEILKFGWQDTEYLDRFAQGLEAWIRDYATCSPSYVKVGYGMTRNEGGGNAIRAITLLPALIGAWKQRGGGGCLSTSGAFGLNVGPVRGDHLLRTGARHVNMNLLASELAPESSKIHSLFVFNSNPAAVAPDSSRIRMGLARDDLFTVVLEHFQTDTADYADYLLPATTFLEHTDVYTSYGHYYLQYSSPVVPARGEAISNHRFFQELATRLHQTDPCLQWNEVRIIEELLKSTNPRLAGITAERLMQERSVKLNLESTQLPYSNGSNFEDGKIRFSPAPQQLTFEVQPTHEFPLRLISPPGPFILNTSMGNVPEVIRIAGGEPQVVVHPQDAKKAGIRDQDRIRIVSNSGSISRKVIVSDDALQGVLVALGQWWPKLAPDRKGLNDITDERLTDLGGGSTFGNPVVRIEKLSGPS